MCGAELGCAARRLLQRRMEIGEYEAALKVRARKRASERAKRPE